MTLPDGFATGQSLQSLDQNQQLLAKHGYGVVSGCSVSIYNGTLGSSEATVEVSSGTLLVGGSTVDVASTTLGVPASDVDPRKDLIVYDTGSSALSVVEGQAEDADPSGSVRQQARIPRPPSLESSVTAISGSGDPKIPLAEVWVPADSSSITSDDLFDRRQAIEPSVDVSDDGTTVVSDATDINYGNNLNVVDDGDGSVTVDSPETNTLYMSDYTSGGVADSAFDSAVTDATAGDTLVIDVSIELTSGHTISKSITIDSTSDVTVSCTNTSNNNAHILFQGGGTGSSTTTTEITNVGERTIGVNDTTIFAAGDRVLFMNATYGQTTNAQIQFAEIESVDGTNGNITLMSTISKEFASGVNVYVVDLLDSPEIRNLNTDGGGWRHLQFRWSENPVFDNVSISEYLEVSLYTLDCWKPRYRDVEATDPTGLLSGEGEPIVSYRCTDGLIESPRVYDCRRGIDFAWGSRGFTIIDPVLHGCVIGGITVHQDDEAGNFDIIGGEIVCQTNVPDSAHNGHGISMSSTSETTVTGTKIVARVNGIIASGPTDASGVAIEPADDTSEGRAGILIKSSNCSFDGILIDDSDGHFDEGIWIDSSDGALSNIDVHCKKCDHGNTSLVNVDGRSNNINDVRISGNYYQTTGTANQGMIVQANGTNRVENVWISANIHNVPEQGVRVETNTDGVVDNIVVHDAYLNTGQAAVFSNGSGTFETLRVRDCSADTGSTSVSFNETVSKIFITNNDLSGSIDVGSNSNTTVTGNL